MPGRDRSGPTGQGPITGRGLGVCTGANAPIAGRGLGAGRGFRRFSGVGRGCGWNYNYDVDFDENNLLRQKKALEGRLKAINKELEEVSNDDK